MAKSIRAGASGRKKPRHTAAQKKAARLAREKQARAQLKGRRRDRSEQKDRWRDRDDRDDFRRRDDSRGQGDRRDGRWEERRDGRRDERRDGSWEKRRDGRRDDRRDGRWEERRDGSRTGRGGYPQGPRDGDRGRGRRDDLRRDDFRRRDDGGERRRRDEERGGYPRTERTWRARHEEREGRPYERGRHEGRSWDESRRREGWRENRRDDRRDDRGDDRRERRQEPWEREDRRGARWQDRSQDRGGHHHRGRGHDEPASFEEAEAEREAADAAYQERLAAGLTEDASATVTEDNGFARFGLHEDLVGALARVGITQPFPVQEATIPDALAGRDLLGRAQTGSGKTMAFGLPMLHRLTGRPRAVPHRPRSLILSPTRELAMQIVDALTPLMRAVDKRFLLVAGGMSYTPQLKALERGVDVLVATPGRLIDLVDRSAADLSEVEVTVLDEADHMAEMGFVEAISQILDLTPTDGQRMLFSATLDHGVDKVAQTYLKDPVTHSTDDATASVTTMEHHVFLVHPHHKKPITAAIANRPGRTVVFCRTKLGADRVAGQLRESGVFAAALHGGLNQAQRTRVLDAFKAGTLPVLVATDVAARGIHVDDVSLVLQVDPPADHKDYLHRSGRTARAGDAGVVVTLALPHQKKPVARLLAAAGVDAEPQPVAPEDTPVIETAGGSVPTADPIPQSRLDEILRPRRPQGRGRGRQGGGPRGRGGQGGRYGGGGGRYGDRGPRRQRESGGHGGSRNRRSRDDGDGRPDWRPRG